MSKLLGKFNPFKKNKNKLTDERHEDESYEDYKERRKLQKIVVKNKINGKWLHKNTKESPNYKNPNKKAKRKAAKIERKLRIRGDKNETI